MCACACLFRRGFLNRFGTYIGRHVISTRTGISFLIGIVRNDGGSSLKSTHVAGTVPVMRTSLPLVVFSKATWLYFIVWPANRSEERRAGKARSARASP